MIIYPNIDKIAFSLGPIKVYWYGVMYVFGFIAAWLLARYRILIKKNHTNLTIAQFDDLLFYCALGVIIGGRIGQMLFYDFLTMLREPLVLFKIWQGGMSFHGGLLGVLIACLIFAKKSHKNFFTITDFIAPLTPIGLALGRLGNFINAELWGRVSNVPWAFLFPEAGPLPRHPSQIYEFFLEGIFLFIILWIYSARKRPLAATSAMFLLLYGILRFFVEFFREPESQYGYSFVAFDWLTMGQLLSLIMFFFGALMLLQSYRKNRQNNLNHLS